MNFVTDLTIQRKTVKPGYLPGKLAMLELACISILLAASQWTSPGSTSPAYQKLISFYSRSPQLRRFWKKSRILDRLKGRYTVKIDRVTIYADPTP